MLIPPPSQKVCIICKIKIDEARELVVLREKGCQGINAAAEEWGEKLFAIGYWIKHVTSTAEKSTLR